MKTTSDRVCKHFLIGSSVVVAIFILTWLILPFFVNPHFLSFKRYFRLYNWQLPEHAVGDFDGDGKKDLVSFTGCAFLSAASMGGVYKENQCVASGVDLLLANNSDKKLIGQKYINTDTYNLNLDSFFSDGPRDESKINIKHSYLGVDNQDNTFIIVNTGRKIVAYRVGLNGLLEEVPPGLMIILNEKLYSFSRMVHVFRLYQITLPLFMATILLIAPIEHIYSRFGLKLSETQTILVQVVSLVILSTILYTACKQILKSHQLSDDREE